MTAAETRFAVAVLDRTEQGARLRELLKEERYVVFDTIDAEAALVIVDADAVAADQICALVRARAGLADVPIVLLGTARPALRTTSDAVALGADAFFPRPIHPERVLRKVETYIGRPAGAPPRRPIETWTVPPPEAKALPVAEPLTLPLPVPAPVTVPDRAPAPVPEPVLAAAHAPEPAPGIERTSPPAERSSLPPPPSPLDLPDVNESLAPPPTPHLEIHFDDFDLETPPPPEVPPRPSAPMRPDLARLAALVGEGDYFEILGVPGDANDDLVESAYAAIVRAIVPLRFADMDERARAAQVLAVVNEAYEVLRSPRLREAYRSYLR